MFIQLMPPHYRRDLKIFYLLFKFHETYELPRLYLLLFQYFIDELLKQIKIKYYTQCIVGDNRYACVK